MATPQRLPTVDGDDGEWGDILNQFIEKEHYNTGSDNAANGGHKTVTIRAGTASAGTAPLKFTSGTLLSSAEAGAMEFLNDALYFTITTGAARKTVAMYNASGGATGDIYYRNSGGAFTALPVSTDGYVLKVNSGLPSWMPNTATPAGSSTQVQYNNSGSLAGADGLQYQSDASPNVAITGQEPGHVPLTVRGNPNNDADIQEWQGNWGGRVFSIGSNGQLVGPNDDTMNFFLGSEAEDPFLALIPDYLVASFEGAIGAVVPSHNVLPGVWVRGFEGQTAPYFRAVEEDTDTEKMRIGPTGAITAPTDINTQVDTDYTLILEDANKIIEMDSDSDHTLTILLNEAVSFALGTTIDITQLGTGTVSIEGDDGVSILSLNGQLNLAGQYAGATLYKRGTDEWVLVGALA